MKKTFQPAHETQVTKQNSAVTSNHRTGRIGYTSFQSQGNFRFSTTSLRNKRETVDKTAVKSNGLKTGGSFHCDRSDGLKPGISGGDISVSEQTELSDIAVTNVSLWRGLSDDSSDGKLAAENVETGGLRPKSSPVLHRSAPADKEKAKDRLVKSHSHIEQLQQNLATKLSTATVATFIHEYSPALCRRSHRNVGRSPLIDRKLNGRDSCGSSNVAGPFPTSRNQDNIRNNRKIRYPKSSVGKGDSLGSILIKKKFVFFNGFFGRSVIRCNRKQIDSHKKDVRSPDETEGSRNLDINSPVQSVENGLTRLEGKKGNQHYCADGPSADYISPNCGKTDVNSNKAVFSDTFEKDTEATDKGRNPPPSNSPGPYGDNRSDASQQHNSNTLEPPSKPARVSWTTALIQKLTEEEARKKTKSQTKAQKPKRTVRFPQKKPPKVVNEEKSKFSEGFQKRRESAPLSRPTAEIPTKQLDSEGNSVKKDTKENPSGVILDDKSKDAYANLVSQLLLSNEGDSQQVSELKGEDFVLKQKELEEIRAAIAREECASVISDDDSVILAPITASKESIETGRRKEPKPSGIRRLLPQGLFAQKHRQVDRTDEGCAQEPLLNRADTSRVYPATTTARPVLETAFLSDPNSKLPVRSGVRQQQRSQSSSPSPRHKQPSPRTRRRQDRDQTSIQENEQNSSRIIHQTRSKSLSPARDRSSSAASRASKRTIPDTSLVLEERLQHIRRELSSPPGRDVTRPSSATPPDYPNRVPQRHNSLPLSSNKTIQQEQIYQNTGRVYISAPSNAYYHSPPSRRRQQNKEPKNDLKADDYRRKVSGGSSASSSSSTIVAESPPVSALSWNPLLLNLESNAISGSPDIRKLQQHRHPEHPSEDSGLYGEIRNSVDRDSSALPSHNIDTPDNYSPSNSGLSRKPQGLLQVHHDSTVLQQRSPTSVPSGRLSAPPVASYSIEDYPRRRVRSPEPHRSRQEYEYDQSSRRSLSQPPRLGQSDQKSSLRPSFRPVNPTDKGLARPVAAQLQIKSPQSRPRADDNVNSRETQTARSYIQLQHQQLERNPRNRPHDQQRKLSRQEVEALYWETQKLREGLSSLSQNMSLHPPQLGVRYSSTASLPQQAFSAYRSSIRSEQNSPMLYQPEAVPRQPFRTQSVQNVGGGYGSPILRPQPVYNIVQQHQPVRQARTSHDTNPRAPRARSASPGPNSNRHLSSRSLSLPRSIPSSVMLENQHYKASDSVMSNFARGVPHRNTIGPIRTSSHFPHSPQMRQQSTPTIYEETQQQVGDEVRLRHTERSKHATEVDAGSGNKINKNANSKTQNYVNSVMNRNPSAGNGNCDNKSGSGKRSKKSSSQHLVSPQPYYPPIFKRGSLISTSTCSVDVVDSPMSPKRVSFSSYDEPLYWPTRNGPAPEPPTRQRKAQNTNPDPLLRYEEYSTYANVPQAPNRPLPPVPHDANGSTYGSISRKSRDSKSPTSGFPVSAQRWQQLSESESGSEAGEVQRILQQGSHGRGTYVRFPDTEEEWGADGKSRGPPGTDQSVSNVGRDEEVRRGGGGGGRSGRRDEPRRHTLSGDHHHHQQGSALARSMDLESPLPRGYPPPSSAMLFDDDPGIMSEVETSSTGFRRGGKQRSSLPVVRTPSKTLERPLGLVFLQYRNETKRALLPNEITSIDTVKALFVRSFPKQLTMEYLDSPHVKIYIHDSSKDMFYELEDLRSHLRDIRDRSVLRLFESTDMNGGVLPGAGVGVMAPPMWDQDQTYWSEPEFDSEYQHQHIHKTKASSKSGSSGGGPPQAPYYMTHSYPPGGTQGAPGASATLPRGGPLLRAYSPAVAPVPADRIKSLPQTDRLHSESGYMSSPERGGPRAYPAAAYPPGGPGYEDPYYSQYASRSGSITPVIDEEARIRVEHMERQLANLTGLVQKALTQTPTPREYLQVPPPASARDANYRNAASDEYDKHSSSSSASLPDDSYLRTDTKPPKLGKDKSVSFEKSVSFSDEPPDMNSPKQHSPQHAERTERDRHKPAPPPKPVSLSPGQYEGRHVYRDLQLTPEMYNQLRGLQKKAKDLRQEVRNLRRMSQAQAHSVRETIRDTFMKIRAMLLIGGEEAWAISGDADKVRLNREEDTYKQEMLRLEKDLTELESTVEELRGNVINRKTRVNMSDVENMALILSKSSKTVADLKVRFPSLQEGMKGLLASEMEKVVREEKFLKEEPERLESALRRCKKLTGTLVTLKRLASVQEQRLPPSTTPESRLSPTVGLGGDSDTPITPPAHGKPSAIPARSVMAPTIGGDSSVSRQRPENALDALLDELQTFARPPFRAGSGHNPIMADIGRKGSIDSAHPHAPSLPSSTTGTSSLRRLHSYPSSSDGGGNSPPTVALARLQVSGSSGADAPKSPATSPKPPVPERNSELLSHLAGRRIPPPPPPRTSSRSPLASPTSPSLPPRGQHPPSQPQMGVGGGTLLRRGGPGRSSLREPLRGTPGISVSSSTATAKQEDPNQPQPGFNPLSASNSSSCESINSQEGLQQNKAVSTSSSTGNKARQEILEQRHQELLRKQRALQEQYARLQQLQRSGGGGLAVVPPPDLILKKTGSESNLLAKMGLGHGLSAAAPISGSLTHLAAVAASANPQSIMAQQPQKQMAVSTAPETMTTNAQPTTTTTNKIYETDIL